MQDLWCSSGVEHFPSKQGPGFDLQCYQYIHTYICKYINKKETKKLNIHCLNKLNYT